MKTINNLLMIGLCLPLMLSAELVEDEGEVLGEVTESAVSISKPNVVILNKQKVDQKVQLSNQPSVRVTGTPIVPNQASKLRKSREEAETFTEQKIVETLESSRLRDEQERLNKLLGKTATKQTVVVSGNQAAIQTEVVNTANLYGPSERVYIGVHGGQAANLTRAIENLDSRESLGLSFGATHGSGVGMEASFFYSKHQLRNLEDASVYNNSSSYEDLNAENIDQLSGILSVNYTPLTNRFRPYVGPTISYNQWVYSRQISYGYNNCKGLDISKRCDNQTKTASIDLGARVGMDFQLTKRVSIGFNMHVNVINLYNNRSNSETYSNYDYIQDGYENSLVRLEETNWIIASINAKLYF